ncbi:MAG: ring-hydroxylating dioxygenase, large terminal subunit [Acidimicrobiales bacterium]|nr:ring-hydroxylating dioxygenase, large terminal subunit [Acidimicrobiales bacterium]
MSDRSDTVNRYPFSIPYGWFAVCEPDDLTVGATKALYYFGTHLVAWRDEHGAAHVMDAFCPHLGAHLGHGGTVSGCEIVCPFHGWQFDAEGSNTNIPYSDRTNGRARIRTYPTIERNGFTMVWYHPEEQPPRWEVADVAEVTSGDFSGPKRTSHTVKAAIQEMAENSVDSAHFRYVHHTAEVPEIERYETDGHVAEMRSSQKFPTPRGVVDGRIDTTSLGPGLGTVRFSGIIDTLLVTASTPIDAETTQVRFSFYVRSLGDASTTSSVGEAFAAEVDKQFGEDTPIWEHKAHLVRPALADTDGPFMKFRKWYSQFYVEPVSDERTVFPPPYWPDKMDESPAKATASARHGQS